jgi:DNA invertase Pin-like site-specific DNA recombinase
MPDLVECVLIYSRVSTERDQSPEAQVSELRRYCGARGWEIVEEVTDHGYSGGTDQRPGLKRLLVLARSRKIDRIVVTKLDRLARSLKHLVSLLDEFTTLGIHFISIHDQIDLSTASGRLMLHIVAAFAEFERALIRERTVLGLIHARSKGVVLGRPKTRDDETIKALRKKGLSYAGIQKRLRISKGAVCRALSRGTPKTPSKQIAKVKTY